MMPPLPNANAHLITSEFHYRGCIYLRLQANRKCHHLDLALKGGENLLEKSMGHHLTYITMSKNRHILQNMTTFGQLP